MKKARIQKEEQQVRWSIYSRSIFEKFAAQLEAYTAGGELPSYADQDVQFALELQKSRLQEKNLEMRYEFRPRGHFADKGGFGRSWSDECYTSTMEYRSCEQTRSFWRNGKRIYRKKRNMLFYGIITNILNVQMAGEDLYTCPSCAGISKMKQLQESCPYCGTHFEMSDLFPKITNYYFIKDAGGTPQEIKGSILKKIIPTILICIVLFSAFYHFSGMTKHWSIAVLTGIFAGVIGGGIFGYLIWASGMLGSLFLEAGKSVILLLDAAGSRKKFVNLMQKYSPEFSFEYFTGKVISTLKMILYSENPKDLPCYTGNALDGRIRNIVESSYTGAVALKKFRVTGKVCYVDVNVYMDDIYEESGKIRTRRDVFRMSLQKDISTPLNLHMSIRKIACKTCGNSFDAAKQKYCPSCGSSYDLSMEDWVVTAIKLM